MVQVVVVRPHSGQLIKSARIQHHRHRFQEGVHVDGFFHYLDEIFVGRQIDFGDQIQHIAGIFVGGF